MSDSNEKPGKKLSIADKFLGIFAKKKAKPQVPVESLEAKELRLAQQKQELKLGEVDILMGELANARLAFTAPYAEGPDDLAVGLLQNRRDALANATTRDDIDREVDNANTLLTDIDQATKASLKAQQDWVALQLQQTTKLGEVDVALGLLDTARKAITAPYKDGPDDPAVLLLTNRRDALANATDKTEIGTQVGLAGALLTDIDVARQAAVQVELDWMGRDLDRTSKLMEVDDALLELGTSVAQFTGPYKDGPDASAVSLLEGRRESLANATTKIDIDTQLGLAAALVIDIGLAKDAAVKAQQDWLALALQQTTKLGEVDVALGLLDTARKAVKAPYKDGPDDPAVLLLTNRRDLLANAKERAEIGTQVGLAGALVVDIGLAKDAAEKAQQDWLALELQQTTKLGEVDVALGLLDTARKAIKATYKDGPDDPAVLLLTNRRDLLANAKEKAGIGTQVGLAGALVTDIGLAKDAAVKAQQDWLPRKQRQDAVERVLNDTKATLAKISTASVKLATENKNNQHLLDLTALASKTTPQTYEVALSALELNAPLVKTEVDTLFADTWRPHAVTAVNNLKSKEGELKAVKTPNALSAVLTKAELDLGVADLLTDQRARSNAYSTIYNTATAATKKATDLMTERQSLRELMTNAESWFKTLSTGAQGTLPTEKAAVTTKVDEAVGKATLGEFQSALATQRLAGDDVYNRSVAGAVPDLARTMLVNLASWAPDFNKIRVPNAVKALYDKLLQDEASALLLSGQPRVEKLKTTYFAASEGCKDASAALEVRKEIAKQIYALEQVPLTSLNPLVTAEANLIAEKENIKVTGVLTACTTTAASAIPDLKAQFEILLNKVGLLKGKIDIRLAAKVNITTKKQEITTALGVLDGILTKMTDVDPKPALLLEAGQKRTELTGVDSLTGDPAKKKALFDLARAVQEMIVRAGKAAFATMSPSEIDTEIGLMGETTTDPAKQALCRAALESRFKLEFDMPEGMNCATLPTIYAMFKKVPASHVGHDKLTKLAYETDPDSGSSYYGASKIVLNKIGDGTGLYDMVSQGDTPSTEKVNYFKATTLHEIGHAVDDKNKVMKENDDAYGGWKKVTIPDVAAALYEKDFKGFVGTGKGKKEDAMALITALLEKGVCADPPSATGKLGSLHGQWNEIKDRAGWANCLKVRNPTGNDQPWQTPVVCTDGYAYHEAYAGDWYRYKHAERAKGISEYQWRAPGEWFSELYAYHHMLGKPVPSCVEAAIKT